MVCAMLYVFSDSRMSDTVDTDPGVDSDNEVENTDNEFERVKIGDLTSVEGIKLALRTNNVSNEATKNINPLDQHIFVTT